MGPVEIANPRLPNVWVGPFGFKSYFLYVPLLFVVPALFTSPGQLERFLRRYALVAIPVGLLAVAQFASPASSVLNAYAAAGMEGAQAITFGSSERVRVTGTFSFITGYSIYLIAVGFLLLGLLAHARWRVRCYASGTALSRGQRTDMCGENLASGTTGAAGSAGESGETGEPAGKGSALLPISDKPKTLWLYQREEIPRIESHHAMLFILLDKDILDGYLWFSTFRGK